MLCPGRNLVCRTTCKSGASWGVSRGAVVQVPPAAQQQLHIQHNSSSTRAKQQLHTRHNSSSDRHSRVTICGALLVNRVFLDIVLNVELRSKGTEGGKRDRQEINWRYRGIEGAIDMLWLLYYKRKLSIYLCVCVCLYVCTRISREIPHVQRGRGRGMLFKKLLCLTQES